MNPLIVLVHANLEQQASAKDTVVYSDEPSPGMMKYYTISKAGITFIFPPYLVSGYSSGTWTSTVPFWAVKDYMAQTPTTSLLLMTQMGH